MKDEVQGPEVDALKLAVAGWSVGNGARVLASQFNMNMDDARELMSKYILQQALGTYDVAYMLPTQAVGNPEGT